MGFSHCSKMVGSLSLIGGPGIFLMVFVQSRIVFPEVVSYVLPDQRADPACDAAELTAARGLREIADHGFHLERGSPFRFAGAWQVGQLGCHHPCF
jgi:hypothetical protein